MQKFVFFLFFLMPALAYSYPQFIGYKYDTCLTCHYNGQGGGQLNDYGRALWATEIAGRHFVSQYSVEELGEISGFLFGKKLPWWMRVGFKMRQIWAKTNPMRTESRSRSILMQADANLALFLDRDQKFSLISTLGYASDEMQQLNELSGKGSSSFISREHYLRWHFKEPLWFYVGKLDKVYGIRHANHTSFSRSRLGLSHSDQSYGVVGHYIQEKWELSLNLFLGDLTADKEFQEQGVSILYEFARKENWRLGVSALFSQSDALDRTLVGVHSRLGLGHGMALMAEGGLAQTQAGDADSKLGYYFYSEAMQRVKRGYHLFVTAQAYKADMSGGNPDNLKMGAGVLIFPLQRVEWRIEVENSHAIYSSSQDTKDNWALLGQLHLSL